MQATRPQDLEEVQISTSKFLARNKREERELSKYRDDDIYLSGPGERKVVLYHIFSFKPMSKPIQLSSSHFKNATSAPPWSYTLTFAKVSQKAEAKIRREHAAKNSQTPGTTLMYAVLKEVKIKTDRNKDIIFTLSAPSTFVPIQLRKNKTGTDDVQNLHAIVKCTRCLVVPRNMQAPRPQPTFIFQLVLVHGGMSELRAKFIFLHRQIAPMNIARYSWGVGCNPDTCKVSKIHGWPIYSGDEQPFVNQSLVGIFYKEPRPNASDDDRNLIVIPGPVIITAASSSATSDALGTSEADINYDEELEMEISSTLHAYRSELEEIEGGRQVEAERQGLQSQRAEMLDKVAQLRQDLQQVLQAKNDKASRVRDLEAEITELQRTYSEDEKFYGKYLTYLKEVQKPDNELEALRTELLISETGCLANQSQSNAEANAVQLQGTLAELRSQIEQCQGRLGTLVRCPVSRRKIPASVEQALALVYDSIREAQARLKKIDARWSAAKHSRYLGFDKMSRTSVALKERHRTQMRELQTEYESRTISLGLLKTKAELAEKNAKKCSTGQSEEITRKQQYIENLNRAIEIAKPVDINTLGKLRFDKDMQRFISELFMDDVGDKAETWLQEQLDALEKSTPQVQATRQFCETRKNNILLWIQLQAAYSSLFSSLFPQSRTAKDRASNFSTEPKRLELTVLIGKIHKRWCTYLRMKFGYNGADPQIVRMFDKAAIEAFALKNMNNDDFWWIDYDK